MLKEDLVVLLDLPPNSEITDVYSKARRYAKSVHSDANPDKHSEWMRFEPAWDVIKKLHTQKRSFDDYIQELENVKWKPSNSANKTTDSKERPKSEEETASTGRTQQPPPKNPKKGSDIFLHEKIGFDDLVYGCTLILRIPRNSAVFDSKHPSETLEVVVSPTLLSFNKNGSISKSSLDKIFNKKIKVFGAGEKGRDGGRAGDLIIELALDFDNAGKSIYEIVNKHMLLQYGVTFPQKSPSPVAPFLGLAIVVGSLLVLNVENTFLAFLGVAGFFGGFIYLVSSLLD